MSTPEINISEASLSQRYELLDSNIDPLELAEQALVKLKLAGLSGYIAPKDPEVIEQAQEAEVILLPTALVKSQTRTEQPTKGDKKEPIRKPSQLELHTVSDKLISENLRSMPGRYTTEELFDRAGQGDPRAREVIVRNYMPLARRLAKKYMVRYEQLEDLTQVASIGLINAVNRFDSSKGFKFEAFAIPTMLGEIRRYFRDHGWAMHVPRGIQERALDIKKLVNEAHLEGRELKTEYIAKALSLTEEQVIEAQQAWKFAYSPDSLNAPLNDQDSEEPREMGDVIKDEAAEILFDDHLDQIDLMNAIDQLPDDRLKAIILYRLNGRTQKEVAKRLGISQMQISRLERKAIAIMGQYVSTDLVQNDQAELYEAN